MVKKQENQEEPLCWYDPLDFTFSPSTWFPYPQISQKRIPPISPVPVFCSSCSRELMDCWSAALPALVQPRFTGLSFRDQVRAPWWTVEAPVGLTGWETGFDGNSRADRAVSCCFERRRFFELHSPEAIFVLLLS